MPCEKCVWISSCYGFLTFGCMKAHLMGLIMQGLFFAQVTTHRKGHVKKKALNNELMIYDTFVLPYDVRNLTKKKINELWHKHPKDPISVRMWVLKNLHSIFNYVQHAPLDLNLPIEDDTLFMLGIQIEMMKKCGHHNSISFNATFNTNQNKVNLFFHYMKCIKKFIVPNVCNVYFSIFLYIMVRFDE